MALESFTRTLAATRAAFELQITRWRTQAGYLRWLAATHSALADALPLLADGDHAVQAAIRSGELSTLQHALIEAERSLASFASVARSYQIHLVGHAHIDMNWMWSWQETVAVTLDSFRTVLRLMDEFPQFHFSQSQAAIYRIVEQFDPAMLLKIGQLVKQGRWEVTASHWVECDKNMAAGESLCRQVLYTRAYLQDLLGLPADSAQIDWAPDTFGHPATMPSYLSAAGIRWIYLHRPGVWTEPKPEAFRWRAPDGASVLAVNDMKRGYNGQIRPGVVEHLMDFCQNTGSRDLMFVYGVGDHGGGPTRRDLQWALEMMRWPLCPEIRFSTAHGFFRRLETIADRLPVIEGELNTEFTGCYTSQSLVKRGNRLGETRLGEAEVSACLAKTLVGAPYPSVLLLDAWRNVLFNQFHDILPGSGVRDTRTHAHGMMQQTLAIAGQCDSQSLRAVSDRIDTRHWKNSIADALLAEGGPAMSGGGAGYRAAEGAAVWAERGDVSGAHPRIIFNPTAFDRAEVIELTVWDNALPAIPTEQKTPMGERRFTVIDTDGKVVAHQRVEVGAFFGHDFARLAVPANVPAFGYSRLLVIDEPSDGIESLVVPFNPPANTEGAHHVGWSHHCAYAPTEQSIEGLANQHVLLEIDQQTGGIRRFLEERTRIDLLADAAGASLEFGIERPHGMTSWCIDRTGPISQPIVQKIKRTEMGPLQASVTVTVRIGHSVFDMVYQLRDDDPQLRITIRGKWLEPGSPEIGVPVLRLSIPTSLQKIRARYEIPFGSIERPQHRAEEVPALRWASFVGERAGLVLLNSGQHGYSLDDSTVRLTLIRSSYDPDPLPEIGEHAIELALIPVAAPMEVGIATQLADRFNHPLKTMSTGVHDGDLSTSMSMLSIDNQAVSILALKAAEDGDGLIVRLLNPTETVQDCTLRLCPSLADACRTAQMVDVLERSLGDHGCSRSGADVAFAIRPFSMLSLRLAGSAMPID